MDVEISLFGLDLPGWLPLLEGRLSEVQMESLIIISPVAPPPGALGAGAGAMIKASLTGTVGLATVIGAAASLYSAVNPRPTACEVSVQSGEIRTVMTYDCKDADPVRLAQAVSRLVAESLPAHVSRHGQPHKVILRPVRSHAPKLTE